MLFLKSETESGHLGRCRGLMVTLVHFYVDLNRTFPDNVRFRKTAEPCLQKTLYNVLLAYGLHNQGVGYCQVSPQSPRAGMCVWESFDNPQVHGSDILQVQALFLAHELWVRMPPSQ